MSDIYKLRDKQGIHCGDIEIAQANDRRTSLQCICDRHTYIVVGN